MNAVLWILQIVLALQAFAGGAYKVVRFDDIAQTPAMQDLSRGAWAMIGGYEVACAVLLVVPAAIGWMPVLAAVGAAALAVESFGLAVLYGRHSGALAADNPLVYVLVGGVLATVVAVGRTAL
ncbi:MAG: DoxX family protein [Myxococcota bacterium]